MKTSPPRWPDWLEVLVLLFCLLGILLLAAGGMRSPTSTTSSSSTSLPACELQLPSCRITD